MLILALKLFLAHILGDFVFQPDKWEKDKREFKHKSPFLYWHILVHFAALCFVLQFDLKYWLAVLIIVLTHYIIDVFKLHATTKKNKRWLFFLDQGLHLLVLVGVVNVYYPFDWSFIQQPIEAHYLLITAAILTVTFVSSIVAKILISKWKPTEKEGEKTLKHAGMYIGMLERLFIFGFVVSNYWEGIGFLLAAKSVFRFGDLSNANDRNLTEYILIGTFLSFGLAILIAMAYLNISLLI